MTVARVRSAWFWMAMTKRDRGVHPDLLRRHFGDAGTGADIPDRLRRELEREERRKAAAELAKMRRALPKKPPKPAT